MSDLNGFIYTEPKRRYYKEYTAACREAIEKNDTEWMPVKKENLSQDFWPKN